MSKTLTIRTDPALRDALDRRAADQKTTVSEVAREILRDALAEQPMAQRTGHLKGRLELPADEADAWSQELADRNWRW